MSHTRMYAVVLGLCSLVLDAQGQEPNAAPEGGYLVVELGLGLDSEGAGSFAASARKVAREVADFHAGRVVAFDGQDWDGWRDTLREQRPDEVLFVVPPQLLDVALHRRILLASADLDADPLPDFAWGYFTAAEGAGLERLWARTKGVHANGLQGRTWFDVAVATGMKSAVYAGYIPDTAKAAGYEGDSIYFATIDADADNLEFVDAQLPRLQQAAVLEFTGNGDPEGIWLFPGERNLDRSLHWAYDPERVGEDPQGEMPRVSAVYFAKLELQAPVVWSGTCHSAATQRVFVEGDIVSTFGSTERTTLHLLPPERSLCLAMLEAGAVAFLAPIGANHGMSVSRERDVALTRGCTLGEALKSTWDDVFLAAGGPPPLTVPVPGEPHGRGAPIMQGGGCNRILIGDPALRPFPSTAHPRETVTTAAVEGGFDVTVAWQPGWHPMAWDMYGTERQADWRVLARVPLTALLPADEPLPDWSIRVAAVDPEGSATRHALRHAVVEDWRGQRFLHLQANAPRAEVERKGVTAVFEVRWGE